MDLEYILYWMQNFGYAGLYVYLAIGVFAFPIPNEILIFTIAIASEKGFLNPFGAYITIILGVLSALTLAYAIGRSFGYHIMSILMKRPKIVKIINRSQKLLNKYHAPSLLFSYFIPGVRLFLPFLYGFSKLSFSSFAVFGYIGAFIWVTIAYVVGYFFGDVADQIWKYEKLIGFVLIIIVSIIFIFVIIRKKQKEGDR